MQSGGNALFYLLVNLTPLIEHDGSWGLLSSHFNGRLPLVLVLRIRLSWQISPYPASRSYSIINLPPLFLWIRPPCAPPLASLCVALPSPVKHTAVLVDPSPVSCPIIYCAQGGEVECFWKRDPFSSLSANRWQWHIAGKPPREKMISHLSHARAGWEQKRGDLHLRVRGDNKIKIRCNDWEK